MIASDAFALITLSPATSASTASEWLPRWRQHRGALPRSSRLPNITNIQMAITVGAEFRTWRVTADFGNGPQTVGGTADCESALGGCVCRMTAPIMGSEIQIHNRSRDTGNCWYHCANHCAQCVQNGGFQLSLNNNEHAWNCDRGAILSSVAN